MIQTKTSTKILDLLACAVNRVVVVQTAQERRAMSSGLQSRMETKTHAGAAESGFSRMQRCRDALARLDERGWKRSYHQ